MLWLLSLCIPPRALDSGAYYSIRVKDKGRYKKGHLLCCSKEHKMNRFEHTQRSDLLEEAVTILFCLVDDGYQNINPNAQCYESLKKLSDSEVITLALAQQLRGMESQRSFLRDASRFFSHLFPGVIGLALPPCTAGLGSLSENLPPSPKMRLRTGRVALATRRTGVREIDHLQRPWQPRRYLD